MDVVTDGGTWYVSAMLDLAATALEPPLPPEIPRIVDERQWLSTLGAEAERRTTALGNQYDALASEWLTRIERVQREWKQSAEDDVISIESEKLGAVIDRTELFAEHRARRRASFSRQGQKKVKRLFEVDPSVGAVYRVFYARLLALDDRIIEALLGHAMFLRAVRADIDPDARGGPTFSDPDALKRHLRAALAA